MSFSSLDVANCFLDIAELHEENLTLMKLQCLVYFAHGWHLAITGEPLIEDSVVAWEYGPVIPRIYYGFRYLGRGHIDIRAVVDGTVPNLPSSSQYVESRNVIHKVWEEFGKFTEIQIMNLVHMHPDPWQSARGQGDRVIDNNRIRECFIQMAMNKRHRQ